MDFNICCKITRKPRGIHDWGIENTFRVVYLSVVYVGKQPVALKEYCAEYWL